jgi:hypothetical protein
MSLFQVLSRNKGIFDYEILNFSAPHEDDDVKKSWFLPYFN